MDHDPCLFAFWDALADTPAALEQKRIADGDPWTVSALAGLQFHAYHDDDGLDGKVQPRAGDVLHLVREPNSIYDRNAVKVYWRNEHQIGHLARDLAEEVAAALDKGESLRAYVLHEGNGCAWSCKALLVGKPVRRRLTQWTTQAIDEAIRDCWGEERTVLSEYGDPSRRHQICRTITVREACTPPTERQKLAASAWDEHGRNAHLHRKANAAYAFAQLPPDFPKLPDGATLPLDPALRGKTFDWWDQVPPGLMTKTTMRKHGLKAQEPAFGAISYCTRYDHKRYDLYAVSEAVPCTPGSALQRAAAAERAVRRRERHG